MKKIIIIFCVLFTQIAHAQLGGGGGGFFNGVPIALGPGGANQGTQRFKLADEDANAAHVIGQASQTAVVNNILTAVAGTAATDALAYNSGTTTIVSTGTGGTFIFEGSNDNINFEAMPIKRSGLSTGSITTSAITASASQFTYEYSIKYRYIRCRIVTAITGGSIQAFTRLSLTPFAPDVVRVGNSIAADMNVTVGGVVNTTASNAIPISVIDVASAAITTTANTTAITPASGKSFQVLINVTAVSGTTPINRTLIEQSLDGGTTWRTLYEFPQITTAGAYYSPRLPLTGNRIRYNQTILGTTPSFTRSIARIQSNDDVNLVYQTESPSQSATIITGGTAQVLMVGNPARQGFEIQNKSAGDIFFRIGGVASATNGYKLGAGGSYSSPAARVSTLPISVFGATTGQLIEFNEY
jgi:hypothetical protein